MTIKRIAGIVLIGLSLQNTILAEEPAHIVELKKLLKDAAAAGKDFKEQMAHTWLTALKIEQLGKNIKVEELAKNINNISNLDLGTRKTIAFITEFLRAQEVASSIRLAITLSKSEFENLPSEIEKLDIRAQIILANCNKGPQACEKVLRDDIAENDPDWLDKFDADYLYYKKKIEKESKK
jgi:hypothetical protein